MPAFNFYRRRWYSNRWPRRKRYFTRRRFRRPLRRRFWRRRWVRRRRLFKFRKRKLRNIKLKEWQPETIRKCHIKGQLCLFTCGKGHINHNYILTSESYVPTSEPGGGSFSILQMTLRVLYDEYTAGRNWWTSSNSTLPLTRFLGVKLKFYKSEHTDYIVTIHRTGPFEVTRDSYLSTQPTRHLMNRRSFIVPKIGRGPNKKTYIRKRIPPPALFQNKWYFQQDIYNTPLFMLTVSATSLDQMFAPQDQISTNISLWSLNTITFNTANWEKEPYFTKIAGTINIYLWGTEQRTHIEPNQKPKWKDLILLGDIKNYKEGKPLTENTIQVITQTSQKENWGNPFYHSHADEHAIIWYGDKPKSTDNINNDANVLPLENIWIECRYNPFKDKGTGNKVYLVPTDTGNGSFLSLPTNENLIVQDLPLWLVLWSWGDWILKSRPIAHLNEEYQLLIISKYIHPTLPCYLFIDKFFRNPEGYTAYLTETDKRHWHPKYGYQQEQLELIAETGPATPKINNTKQIEAHMFYDFYFKWGGSPAPMETITDPAKQEKFPTPSNQLQGLQIESPGKPKQYHLYSFDERQSEITLKAAKRLKQDYSTPTFFTEFGPKDIPLQEEKTSQIPSEEEEVQTPLSREDELRLQLKQQRQQYRDRLRKLLKTKKLLPP